MAPRRPGPTCSRSSTGGSGSSRRPRRGPISCTGARWWWRSGCSSPSRPSSACGCCWASRPSTRARAPPSRACSATRTPSSAPPTFSSRSIGPTRPTTSWPICISGGWPPRCWIPTSAPASWRRWRRCTRSSAATWGRRSRCGPGRSGRLPARPPSSATSSGWPRPAGPGRSWPSCTSRWSTRRWRRTSRSTTPASWPACARRPWATSTARPRATGARSTPPATSARCWGTWPASTSAAADILTWPRFWLDRPRPGWTRPNRPRCCSGWATCARSAWPTCPARWRPTARCSSASRATAPPALRWSGWCATSGSAPRWSPSSSRCTTPSTTMCAWPRSLATKLSVTPEAIDRAAIYSRLVELAEAQLGDPVRALDAAGGWLAEDPTSEEALAELARLAQETGRWGEMVARLGGIAASTESVPVVLPLITRMGQVQLDREGDLDAAEASFRRVLELEPEATEALASAGADLPPAGRPGRPGRGAVAPGRAVVRRRAQAAGAPGRGRRSARAPGRPGRRRARLARGARSRRGRPRGARPAGRDLRRAGRPGRA